MKTKKTILSFSLALAFFVLTASSARANCEAFPKVPWWGNLNHVTAETFVARKFKGDWNPYVSKWSNQVDKLKDVYARESSVFVNYKGQKVKIAGNALANYIKLVTKRVFVIQCLAKNITDSNFATVSRK